MEKMFVSIIIPTLNEEQFIGECLESIKNQTYKNYEVIIVDSGSKDKTLEIAKKYKAKIVFEPRLGFAIAKNTGARKSKGDILVFTDADSLYEKEWIEKIVKRFDDKKVTVCGGPLKPMEKGLKHEIVYKLTTDCIPRIASFFGFYVFQAPNTAFKRKHFFELGGFNEKLRKLEDNELPNRMRKMGKIVFDPSIIVYSSARRFIKEGYLKSTLRFLLGYFNLYVLKSEKTLGKEYPLIR